MGDVKGFCPMGCGPFLRLWADNTVYCSAPGCPDREAVAKILSDEETEHVVTFGATGYSMQHPLRERIDSALLHCAEGNWLDEHGLHMHARLGEGTFRMTWNGDPDYGFSQL